MGDKLAGWHMKWGGVRALAVLCAILTGYWLSSNSAPQKASEATRDETSIASVASGPAAPAAETEVPRTAQVPLAPTLVKDVPASLPNGLRSADPLSQIVQLREQKRPGTFALASFVINECRIAYMSQASNPQGNFIGELKRGEVQAIPGLDALAQANRIAAAQEIVARCVPVWQMQETHKSLPDDAYGRDFELAMQEMSVAKAFPRAALQKLASQGALYWLALDMVAEDDTPPRYFEGQLLGGLSSKDAYNRALWLAAEAATDNKASASVRHLSNLASCVRTGVCRTELGTQHVDHLPLDSIVRTDALMIFPRMAAAMQRGDVEAFAPPAQKATRVPSP